MKKLGKQMVLLATACAFVAIQVGVASAETKMCFGTELTRIGVTPSDLANGNSGYRFEAKGGSCALPAAFPMFLNTELGDAGLATLLTAFSLGKPITMRAPVDSQGKIPENSLVGTIHLDL